MVEVRRLNGDTDTLSDLRPELREALRSMNFDERMQAARIARKAALAAKAAPQVEQPPVETPPAETPARRLHPAWALAVLAIAIPVLLIATPRSAAPPIVATTLAQAPSPSVGENPTFTPGTDTRISFPATAALGLPTVSQQLPKPNPLARPTAFRSPMLDEPMPPAMAPAPPTRLEPVLATFRPEMPLAIAPDAAFSPVEPLNPRVFVANTATPPPPRPALVGSIATDADQANVRLPFAALAAVEPPPAPPQTRVASPVSPALHHASRAAVHLYMPIRSVRSERLGAQLNRDGYDLSAVNVVGYTIPEDEVRYGDPRDKPTAHEIAQATGATARRMDVPNWPSGTVELWLSGSPNAYTSAQVLSPSHSPRPIAARGETR